MGQPKALLAFGGETFIARVNAAIAPHVNRVVVVTRAELAAPIAERVPTAQVVVNPQPEIGMQSSVCAGLVGLETVSRVLIALVDQPHLRGETVQRLVAAPADRIVLPRAADGRRGHPVIFPADLLDALRQPHPEGLREVVWRNADRVLEIEVDDTAPFSNINTPAELDALRAEEGKNWRRL